MKSELQQILDAACAELCRQVDVEDTSFYRLMLSKNVLQSEQIEACKIAGTKFKQMEKVLSLLKRQRDECFELFCEVLTEIDREELVNELLKPPSTSVTTARSGRKTSTGKRKAPTGDKDHTEPKRRPTRSAASAAGTSTSGATAEETPLPSSFDEAFAGKTYELCKMIDARHGLLTQLVDRKVLTDIQKNTIEGVTNDYKLNEDLLKALKQRGDEDLPKFYAALVATNQNAVIAIIIGREPEDGEFV